MDGRRRERRWLAVGFALALGGAMAGSAATPHEGRRTWLLIQEEVAASAVADHDQRVRSALERLRSSQPLEVFMLRDDGFATFVATARAESSAEIEALDTLPRALLGSDALVDDANEAAGVPPARLLTSRPLLSYQPRDEIADRARAGFFRYEFFRVTAAQASNFERVLDRRRDLLRANDVRHAFDVLSGAVGDENQLFVLATGAASRAELDVRSRDLRRRLSRAGHRIERELAKLGQPAGALEGVLVLTWAGQPVEATFAMRGRPPGSWLPSAAILEPLSSAAVTPSVPVLVAVDEPLPPPPPAPKRVRVDAASLESAVTMVRDWARSWSNKQPGEYLAHYAQVFQPPPGLSRSQWQAQRRERLTRPRFIEVQLDELEVEVLGPSRARATFAQAYRADHYRDAVTKRLDLILERGRWRIQRELVLDR